MEHGHGSRRDATGNNDGKNGNRYMYARYRPEEHLQEDLDLLSFSGLDSQVHSMQGPPLKAVYRGPVIGIRYQYPLTVPATSPTVSMTAIDLISRVDKSNVRPVIPPLSGQLCLRVGCCSIYRGHPASVPL